MRHALSTIAAAVAGLAFAGSASALQVDDQGVTYTLNPLGSNQWELSFNSALFNPFGTMGTGDYYVTDVAIKVFAQNTDADLVAGPIGWGVSEVNGGLNSSGCAGGGGGFACATGPRLAGGPQSFTFEIYGTNLIEYPNFPSIKARYEDFYGNKVGDLVSVQAVPEPTTYALMLAGLAAVGFIARRRQA